MTLSVCRHRYTHRPQYSSETFIARTNSSTASRALQCHLFVHHDQNPSFRNEPSKYTISTAPSAVAVRKPSYEPDRKKMHIHSVSLNVSWDTLYLAARAENVGIAQYLHAIGSHRPYGRRTISQGVLTARALHSKVCLSRSCDVKLSTDISPAIHKSPSAQFPPKPDAQAHGARHII